MIADDKKPVTSERCRECVHVRPIVDMETGDELNVLWCELLDLESCEPEDYCSMGERREEGTQ